MVLRAALLTLFLPCPTTISSNDSCSHMPPMAPGERRVKKLNLYAPGDPVTEVIVITKIE